MNELERVAKMVARERISRGLSQQDLVLASRVGLSTIQRIEQGRAPQPTPRIMHKLAIGFGMAYDEGRGVFVAKVNGGADADKLARLRDFLAENGIDVIDALTDLQKQAASMSEAARKKVEAKKKGRGQS